jgi:superfamily II DNA/RNA helicase
MQNLQCQTFIGGLSAKGDTGKLKQCQVIVGTPGKIADEPQPHCKGRVLTDIHFTTRQGD